MRTVRVSPVPGGWLLDNDLTGAPLMFRSGGAAERNARELARLHANQGEQAQVLVHDRTGVIVGSIVVGPGRG